VKEYSLLVAAGPNLYQPLPS